ncbi:hypothetical protein Gpo141_00000018 [Globisporangium polare]
MSEGKLKIFQKGHVLSYGVIGAEEAERIRGLTFVLLLRVLCVHCIMLHEQVFSQCQEGDVISPRSCLYISKWGELKDLEFEAGLPSQLNLHSSKRQCAMRTSKQHMRT